MYVESALLLALVSIIWLWCEAVAYLRRPVITITTIDQVQVDVVERLSTDRRRLLLAAVIGLIVSVLMFVPFIVLYFMYAG